MEDGAGEDGKRKTPTRGTTLDPKRKHILDDLLASPGPATSSSSNLAIADGNNLAALVTSLMSIVGAQKEQIQASTRLLEEQREWMKRRPDPAPRR